jgi:hypothetical protein
MRGSTNKIHGNEEQSGKETTQVKKSLSENMSPNLQ